MEPLKSLSASPARLLWFTAHAGSRRGLVIVGERLSMAFIRGPQALFS